MEQSGSDPSTSHTRVAKEALISPHVCIEGCSRSGNWYPIGNTQIEDIMDQTKLDQAIALIQRRKHMKNATSKASAQIADGAQMLRQEDMAPTGQPRGAAVPGTTFQSEASTGVSGGNRYKRSFRKKRPTKRRPKKRRPTKRKYTKRRPTKKRRAGK